MRSLRLLTLLVFVATSSSAWAQEENPDTPEPTTTTESTETPADEPPPAELDPVDPEPTEPAEPAITEEDSPASDVATEEMSLDDSTTEEPVETEPPANQESADPDLDKEAGDEIDEGADEEGFAEEAGNDESNWVGIVERAPAFFALTHHAAVHMPIALWLLGGFFVLLGLIVPSWRNQVPLACLLGGTATAVASAASGWWFAEYEWGAEWAWGDGFGDFSERIVQHRWTGVALALASLFISLLAIISQAKQSKKLGFIWRVGLLLLAAAVAWEGHIGGELIHGEGYIKEALQDWLWPEA